MRKGIVFSLISLFISLSLISTSANIRVRINNEVKYINEEIPERIDRDIYSTVSNNIERLYGTSVEYKDGLTIKEIMPLNISSRVNAYESFIDNIYINQTTSTIKFTRKEEALLIGNHSRINYGINKSDFNLTSNNSIDYINLKINATSTQNTTLTDWVWTTNGTYVNLTIRDAILNTALINGSASGYINASRLNTFNITYNNGKTLTVKIGTSLLVNATLPINTSLATNLIGEVYTGHVVRINNSVLELVKEYNTIVR